MTAGSRLTCYLPVIVPVEMVSDVQSHSKIDDNLVLQFPQGSLYLRIGYWYAVCRRRQLSVHERRSILSQDDKSPQFQARRSVKFPKEICREHCA